MKIRPFERSDEPIVKEWFKDAGFDYDFPDFADPIFEKVLVAVDENDKPVQLVAAKRTVEMYVLMDKRWGNPRWRLHALGLLHEAMRLLLLKLGFEDANCWLPPEVEKSFGRRLVRLFGWRPSRWKSFSRMVKD